MLVIIQIRNVYGNNVAYPVCDHAKEFTRLTGKKTLSRNDLYAIERLGFVVKVSVMGITEVHHWNGEL
jgi:hypothetical protein